MLFNSYVFLFLFLPITALGYFALRGRDLHRPAIAWLVAASLFFYGWWKIEYVALLLFSILFNYGAGTLLARRPAQKTLLAAGIAIDLGLLGYFKYAGFFVDSLATVTGAGFRIDDIVLPLAISFFTFQQIAYLVDAYRGYTREYNFLHYCLFVTFFPQLIAGPIVHHREMMSQFADTERRGVDWSRVELGVTLLALGLFKKVMLADHIAVYATPVFDAAAMGQAPTAVDAWVATLAYTFQLYFDFSGYSDMAIGLGLIFGIRLPINFLSPYQATSMIDFWRRWHITLSRFLRDYLYVPLGGNRKGKARRYGNLMITMLLGGLWHGAGWTFVLWGALHGFYLAVNHLWRAITVGHRQTLESSPSARLAGGALTFLAVALAWVLFRAADLDAAVAMYQSLFRLNDVGLGPEKTPALAFYLLGTLAAIAWLLPNAPTWARYHEEGQATPLPAHRLAALVPRFRPNPAWAVFAAAVTVGAVLGLTHLSEFLYFQF